MFLLHEPTGELIRAFLDGQRSCQFTYPSVGSSNTTPPPGFNVDHACVRLGTGGTVFSAAVQALRAWKQFDLGWVAAGPNDTPVEVGRVIAVWARVLGVTILNACRIIYVIDEKGPVTRFGFGYGTLPDHVESGEERFLVEWDHARDEVSYDILAFSRPRHLLARIGFPFARLQQQRFRHDSSAAMQAAVTLAIAQNRDNLATMR